MHDEGTQIEIHSEQSLWELEQRIENGIDTFIDVGEALMEVRDRKLYIEAGFGRFEDYCQERWGFQRRRAYQLMEAASVSQKMAQALSETKNFTHDESPLLLPSNDFKLRELHRLQDPEAMAEVWSRLLAEKGDERKVTGMEVRWAVERYWNPSLGSGQDREVKHEPVKRSSKGKARPEPEETSGSPVIATARQSARQIQIHLRRMPATRLAAALADSGTEADRKQIERLEREMRTWLQAFATARPLLETRQEVETRP